MIAISTRVYIFAGFLESGKTTAMQGVIFRNSTIFPTSDKSLIICTEEGEEEFDEERLESINTSLVTIEEEEALNLEYMMSLQETYNPSAVYIEFNGMWDLRKFVEQPLPIGWILLNIFTFVDATTFQIYLSNMRQIIMNPISVADVIMFNRCDDNVNKGEIRRPIRILNPNGKIFFSRMDGTIDDGTDELLMPQEDGIIHVDEDLFCSWFVDCIENTDKYIGKKVRLKAMVTSGVDLGENEFYAGRLAAICCQADAQFIGFIAKSDSHKPIDKEWIELEAIIEKGQISANKQIILLKAESIEPIEEPEDIYVYA